MVKVDISSKIKKFVVVILCMGFPLQAKDVILSYKDPIGGNDETIEYYNDNTYLLNGEEEGNYEVKIVAGKRSGKFIYYYSSGEVRLECNYTNDKFNGSYKKFYENGTIEDDAFFKDGKLHGPRKAYHSNGNQSFEGSYAEGKEDGTLSFFHEMVV